MNLLKPWIACIALASSSMAFAQGALARVDAEVDATLLDKVKTGDKVRFSADKVDGLITVVAIEPAN
jgi:Cu/Ag efflux protein CusF